MTSAVSKAAHSVICEQIKGVVGLIQEATEISSDSITYRIRIVAYAIMIESLLFLIKIITIPVEGQQDVVIALRQEADRVRGFHSDIATVIDQTVTQLLTESRSMAESTPNGRLPAVSVLSHWLVTTVDVLDKHQLDDMTQQTLRGRVEVFHEVITHMQMSPKELQDMIELLQWLRHPTQLSNDEIRDRIDKALQRLIQRQ